MKLIRSNCVKIGIVIFVLYFSFLLIIYYLQKKEGFTSRIRETYRPYLRKIRLFKDKSYDRFKNTFFSFIRKFGLN